MSKADSTINIANLCTTTLTMSYQTAALYDLSLLDNNNNNHTISDPSINTNRTQDHGNDAIEMTISTSLFVSNLSLEEFYTLQQMSDFIHHHKQIRQTNSTQNSTQKDEKTKNPKMLSKPIKKIAIQCPDELLVDCSLIIRSLKSTRFGHNDVSFYVLGDTSYSSCCVDHVAAQHVDSDLIIHLGFACLTQVEIIPVFYSFGMLSLINFGRNNLQKNVNAQKNSDTTNLYQKYLPLLSTLFKISSTKISLDDIDFSPGYDDYDEYPDDLINFEQNDEKNIEKYKFLVILDQRYSTSRELLAFVLKKIGFSVSGYGMDDDFDIKGVFLGDDMKDLAEFLDQQILPIFNGDNDKNNDKNVNLKIHEKLFLYQIRDRIELVFASPSNSNIDITDNSNNNNNNNNDIINDIIPNQNQDLKTLFSLQNSFLEFAGYKFRISLPEKFNSDPKFRNEILNLSTRQIWHRFFHPTQWKFIFISSHIPFYAPSSLQGINDDKNDKNGSLLQYKTIPDPSSATLLTHFAMNFTQHYIFDCFPYFSLPFSLKNDEIDGIKQNSDLGSNYLVELLVKTGFCENYPQNNSPQSLSVLNESELDSLSMMELFSPSSEQSRVLSQRFYLVEKAKNSSTIGIVAGTLSNKENLLTLERLKKLFTQNGIKYFVILIGKINEAKLLNFGDISMFVVITCPMSVLFRFHNKHGQLHPTTIDQWSLTQKLTAKDSKFAHQQTSNAPATITSMVDIITPYECELAFNTNEFSWNGSYTTHFGDVNANSGRFGLRKENITEDDLDVDLSKINDNDDDKINDKINENKISSNQRNNINKNSEIEDDGVRYSSIDNKYHQVIKKSSNKPSDQPEDPTSPSTQLVEQQTFGLIDPTTNKQLIYVKNHRTGQITVKEREFTGLAQNFDLAAENMVIQPGLHGTSEGYVSVAHRDKNEQGQKY